MEIRQVIAALAALAQETRLKIFRLLVQAGADGVSVGEIGTAVNAAPATLSFHLKELTHAGLIEPRQDGRFIFYSASYPRMNELLGFLTENCCNGDAAVCEPAGCAPTKTARITATRRSTSMAKRSARAR